MDNSEKKNDETFVPHSLNQEGYRENPVFNITGYFNKFYIFRSFNNYMLETKSMLMSFVNPEEDKDDFRFTEQAKLRNHKNMKL
jgi:hypothetical protein